MRADAEPDLQKVLYYPNIGFVHGLYSMAGLRPIAYCDQEVKLLYRSKLVGVYDSSPSGFHFAVTTTP